MEEERRGMLLMKVRGSMVPLKKYSLNHVWFNPHDPWFLRYSPDQLFRGVQVVPVKQSEMSMKENRTGPNAESMVHNCQRKWKIKFATKTKSWTLYFQSQPEYESWRDLFIRVRELPESYPTSLPAGVSGEEKRSSSTGLGRETSSSGKIQENWYESRYGSSPGGSPGSANSLKRKELSASPPLTVSRRPLVMLIVELPQSMGFMRLALQRLDTQVITVERFKERLFEALHMFFHGSALLLSNGSDTTSSAPKSMSKYQKQSCELCHGPIRPTMSRQMFRQEQVILDGPEYFSFQVGSVFSTKEYKPSNPDDVKVLNSRFIQGGGLYKDHPQTSQDDLLLKSFEFVSSPLGNAVSKSVEDCADWIDDESIALSNLVERHFETRPLATPSNTTTVIHLVLRPSRELPLSKFFINVTRYTREYDATKTFSLYRAAVRHGPLKWEIARKYADFRDLDTSLRELDASLPKLPADARRAVWSRNGENDELRLIREMNVYLRAVITEREWDPPPKELLVFTGVLSTGKTDLVEQSSRTQRRSIVHLDALKDIAEFGDLVLFRSVNPLAGWQRRVTGNCMFDHVGIIVKRDKSGYDLLEATGEGVTAYGLEERLEAYYGGFCDLIALRKVRFERSEQACRALAEFTNQVEGKPYKLSLGKLVSGRVLSSSSSQQQQQQRKREYFCSELVAEALKVLGVLTTKSRPDSFFLPHFYDENGVVEKYLTSGSALDDIVFVDCVSPEIKFSEPSVTAT